MEYFYACTASVISSGWVFRKGLKFNLLFAVNGNIAVSCPLHSAGKLRINEKATDKFVLNASLLITANELRDSQQMEHQAHECGG